MFLFATYGEGGPTDDCIEFNDFLEKNKSGVSIGGNKNLSHYSIFGLGSSKYEFFNQMAKKLDKFMEKSGSKR